MNEQEFRSVFYMFLHNEWSNSSILGAENVRLSCMLEMQVHYVRPLIF